ncbi:MAG: hypothetical protein V3U96_10565 [Paracoccaceae bacterium]
MSKLLTRQQQPAKSLRAVGQIRSLIVACFVLAVVVLYADLVLAAGEGLSDQVEMADGGDNCAADDGCKIPYKYLSTEETDPYLVSGNPPSKRADIKAAKRWPSARSCLIEEERNSESPNISKIDWGKMRLHEDVEVCMFRILSSINSVTISKQWFISIGLTDARIFVYELGSQRYLQISASNSPAESQIWYLGQRGLGSKFFKSQVYLESFVARWFLNGRLRLAAFGQSSK